MKKIITYCLASLFAIATFAQGETPEREDNIDWNEDSIEIRTINDIIAQQLLATRVNTSERHFNEVWGRRSYRNLSINMPYTLDPKEPIQTEVPYNGFFAPKYKSHLSFTFSTGRSYRMHKNPIANILQIYIDYTPLDFTVCHYKLETDTAYDSSKQFTITTEKYGNTSTQNYYYTPWNLEKYQADYGMMLGPSITVAPFTMIDNVPSLHHLKLNLYAHFGYRASILYMVNKEEADANYPLHGNSSPNFEEMKDNAKLDWGHGFYWSWGFSLTWKGIGIGYEHNMGNMKYKSIDTGTFGDRSYKFDTSSNRLYISFRVGK
jgi:hypothetical protein